MTGDTAQKSDLLRFVVGPENAVMFDAAQKLPGRGMWLTPARDALEKAIKTKAFSRSAKADLSASPQLADDVESILRRRVLGLLGLSRRAGTLTLGAAKAESGLSHGKAQCLVLASDAAANTVQKFQSHNKAGIPLIDCLCRDELSSLSNGGQVIVAVELDRNRAEQLKTLSAHCGAMKVVATDSVAMKAEAATRAETPEQ